MHFSGSNNVCGVGYYCPSGTQYATQFPCPVGTFKSTTGGADVSAWCVCIKQKKKSCHFISHEIIFGCFFYSIACTPGSFCSANALAAVSGSCSAGFACLGGATVSQPTSAAQGGMVCPVGTFCPTGSASPQPCLAGTYNDVPQQSACSPCPASYFCLGNATSGTAHPCLMGYFCPQGTSFGTQFACPVGTFSNLTALSFSSSCTTCPSGSYCDVVGLTAPRGLCSPGYYCSSNSSSPTQTICPVGSYCEAGAKIPKPCDAGRFEIIMKWLWLKLFAHG